MIAFTQEMLGASYELLRTTPPFNKWNLPEPEEIKFVVTKDASTYGYYDYARKGGKHVIAVSNRMNGYMTSLLEVMAHEMIHLHERRTGMHRSSQHSAVFKRLAAKVCKLHGFDQKRFY